MPQQQGFLAFIQPIDQGHGGGGHPGQPPLGIWGGSGVGPYPDAGFPGPQPGWGGGGQPYPPGGGGGGGPGTQPPQGGHTPPGYWGGGPHPQPPVHYPEVPGQTPPKPGGYPGNLPAQNPDGGWVYAYVPGYGWMWIDTAPPAKPPGGSGGQPPHVDHTLPGDLPHPDQSLPKPPGSVTPPIAPTPAPKKP